MGGGLAGWSQPGGQGREEAGGGVGPGPEEAGPAWPGEGIRAQLVLCSVPATAPCPASGKWGDSGDNVTIRSPGPAHSGSQQELGRHSSASRRDAETGVPPCTMMPPRGPGLFTYLLVLQQAVPVSAPFLLVLLSLPGACQALLWVNQRGSSQDKSISSSRGIIVSRWGCRNCQIGSVQRSS